MSSTSDMIVAMETQAARAMGTTANVQLPHPDEETRSALEARGVVFGTTVDKVLINAELPAGWGLVCNNPRDERHRSLLDEKGNIVAGVFLKNSGYDYYGDIYMD